LRRVGYYAPAAGPSDAAPIAVLQIQRFLGRDLTFLACGRAPHPRWHADRGELVFNDIVLRTVVVGKAENVGWVLDEFERQGWPQSIRLPPEFTGDLLHQTLRSVNKGLHTLRFRARSGNAIYWEITA
jgi:hypothetical protein